MNPQHHKLLNFQWNLQFPDFRPSLDIHFVFPYLREIEAFLKDGGEVLMHHVEEHQNKNLCQYLNTRSEKVRIRYLNQTVCLKVPLGHHEAPIYVVTAAITDYNRTFLVTIGLYFLQTNLS
jgi:hypothetical protein